MISAASIGICYLGGLAIEMEELEEESKISKKKMEDLEEDSKVSKKILEELLEGVKELKELKERTGSVFANVVVGLGSISLCYLLVR